VASKQLEYSFRRALMKKYEILMWHRAGAPIVSRQLDVSLDEETVRHLLDNTSVARIRTFQLRWRNSKPRFKIVACSNGTGQAVRGYSNALGTRAV